MADLRAELVVLGGGPGGYTAAFRAADLGRQVVLVERHAVLGGVCLNVGCIPSKALLHVAEVSNGARHLAEAGVEFGTPKIDLAKLRAYKDGVVGHLTGGLAKLAKARGVQVVTGTGRFESPTRIGVGGADGPIAIDFERAIVAAGSRAVSLPGWPEDPRILDSTSALALTEIPARLLVVGGGIIGLELATVFAALGSEVTIVEALDRLMPGPDVDLVRPLQRLLASRVAGIHLASRVASVTPHTDGLRVSYEGEKPPAQDRFDALLVAVGRRPNGDRIGADAAGLRVDAHGFVPVDGRLATNLPHVFAIGDVARAPLLAHKAMHEGKTAAEVACGLEVVFDVRAIPSVAYTDPEVAWVGLSEAEARERKIEADVARFPWSASGRALGMGRPEGLTKLIYARDTKRLLGAGIVGPHAGELIAECTLAVELGADVDDVALTVHPHPTLAETIGLAAEIANGTITDLAPSRRRG